MGEILFSAGASLSTLLAWLSILLALLYKSLVTPRDECVQGQVVGTHHGA